MSLTFFRESSTGPLAQVDLIRFLLNRNGRKRSKIFPTSRRAGIFSFGINRLDARCMIRA
jgi:hypothetical protein